MTITRLRTAGAETGGTEEADGTASYGGTNFQATTEKKKSGSYSWFISNGSITWSYWYMNFTSTNRMRVGMWLYPDSVSPGFALPIIKIISGATDTVTINFGTSYTELAVLGWESVKDSSSLLLDQWVHYGIDLYAHATSGFVRVWRNGTLDMTFDGNTGSGAVSQLRVGKYAYNFTQQVYADDIYIDDMTGESETAPPILYFRPMFPNGVGDFSQWTPTSGSNYENVDEVPISAADYVQSETLDLKDSYNMTTQTLDVDEECKAILPVVYALGAGSTPKLKVGTRLSGSEELSSEITMPANWDLFTERFETKPGGGAWEQADLDALQLLIESAGTF